MNLSHSSITNTMLNKSFSQPNNISLIEYLIKKLETRTMGLNKTRAAVTNIFDIQDLIENKREMIKHFIEIEEDLKQGTYAIKALLAQNRDFTDKIESLAKNVQQLEIKTEADLNIISQLNERINYLEQDNSTLIESIKEYENRNNYLNDKVIYFEKEVKSKDKEIEELFVINNSIQDKIEKLTEENSLLKMQLESNFESRFGNIENTIYSDRSDFQSKTANNLIKDRKSETEVDYINNKINNQVEAINNVKTILSERENNKKLINEKIKNHFSFGNEKELQIEEPNRELNFKENKPEDDSNVVRLIEKIPIANTSSKSTKKFDTHETEVNKNKADLVSELVLKAVESTENINLLNKKFGNDFMQKLLSEEVSEGFLYQIEETLKQKITNKENLNNMNKSKIQLGSNPDRKTSYNNNQKKEQNSSYDISSLDTIGPKSNIYKFEEELDPEFEKKTTKFQNEKDTANIIAEVNEEYEEPSSNTNKNTFNISDRNIGSKVNNKSFTTEKRNKTDLNHSYSSSNSKLTKGIRPNFEKSLRSYTPSSKRLNKRFINYTSPYGNYFDRDILKPSRPQRALSFSSSMKNLFNNKKND